jgi:DNA-binding transcriptional LysR family regulator
MQGAAGVETLALEIFISIASTNSYTKTAEVFNISQPAVTQNAKRLENQLGVKLVTRGNRGVTLTDAGKEFLPYAETLLETLNLAETRMRNLSLGQHGRIRIAAVPSMSRYVSECLINFRDNYANVQIDVDIFEGAEFMKALTRNDYDFYFAPSDLVENPVLYEHIDIGSDYLSLFVSKEDYDALKKDIDKNGWKALEKYPFISVDMDSHQLRAPTNRVLSFFDISPKFTNYYNRSDSVLLSVGAGIGLALLPHEFVGLYHRTDVVELPWENPNNELHYAFAWKTETLVGAKAIFRDTAIKMFSGLSMNKRKKIKVRIEQGRSPK